MLAPIPKVPERCLNVCNRSRERSRITGSALILPRLIWPQLILFSPQRPSTSESASKDESQCPTGFWAGQAEQELNHPQFGPANFWRA